MPDDIIDFESEKERRTDARIEVRVGADREADAAYWESACRQLADIMESSSNPAAIVRAGLLAMLNRLEDNEGMSRGDAKAFIVERLSFL